MITIKNKHFTAAIAPLGAELRSLKENHTGREIMWSGDPTVWGGSAPILFPVVGASRDGRTTINGQVYPMPKHGVVRTREATITAHGSDRAVLTFAADEQTRQHYPFDFRLDVEFKLNDDRLQVNYRITNNDTETMPFTIGSHPALAIDLEKGTIEDYCIEFDQPETLDRYGLKNGLLAHIKTEYLKESTRIPLSANLFDDDALIFTHIRSECVRLTSSKEPGYLEIDINGAPHLGLWAKPGAAYVCIEPWFSYDDAPDSDGRFETKPGIMQLTPGSCFETGYTLRVAKS